MFTTVLVFLRFLVELETRTERTDGAQTTPLLGWPNNKVMGIDDAY